jgi:hypothetical protein
MKKLKLLKENDVAIRREVSIECDFCGDAGKEVVTSAYNHHIDESRNESQICFDCIRQLAKLV